MSCAARNTALEARLTQLEDMNNMLFNRIEVLEARDQMHTDNIAGLLGYLKLTGKRIPQPGERSFARFLRVFMRNG